MKAYILFVALIAHFDSFCGQENDERSLDESSDEVIDKAIENGAKYLLQLERASSSAKRTDELVLVTLIHAGYDEKNRLVRSLLKRVLTGRLTATYNVSLQAVALQQLDPNRYQRRILECAMFLAYNQCTNGQWSYGGNSDIPTLTGSIYTKFHDAKRSISTGNNDDEDEDKLPDKIIEMKFRKQQRASGIGDNSNTHYAILGLRACAEAGVVFPDETIKKALDFWYDAQNPDGGWGYGGKERGRPVSTGSMTSAGISSLSVLLWLSGKDWKEEAALKKGVEWIGKNFKVDGNPGMWARESAWHYYYLYALERAGVIYKTETFGENEWYKEGTDYLLSTQKKDGTWPDPIIDTCFAILFLKRATKELDSSKIPRKDERKFISTGKGE